MGLPVPEEVFPMRIPICLVLSVLLSAPSVNAAPVDFDQGVEVKPILESVYKEAGVEKRAGAAKSSLEASGDFVWITMDPQDVEALGDAFQLSSREPVGVSSRAKAYKVKVSELPQLSEIMHERFQRCAGFFTHDNWLSANRELSPPPAPAAAPLYSIDQQAVVAPMLEMVDESRISSVISQLASYKNRYYTSETGVSAARWIHSYWSELAAGRGDITVELYPHSRWAQESVILTVRGQGAPGEVVVLGGHEDSIAGYWGGSTARAPGADDNASGIAVLTEAIQMLVASGYRPHRTIQFMAYAAEEVGLRGSKAIATQYQGGGVNVVGVAQFDMTNYKGSNDDIYFIDDNTHSTQNEFMGRLLDEYTSYSWGYSSCGYGCSDHAAWTASGFPASFPFEAAKDGMNPNIHSARDTLESSGGNSLHSVKFSKLAVAYMVEMAK